ncbi:aldehyde dehydrogenase family protein [Sinimarinibacterium thermocellulolyticum]|uniref:Aldehyde dehydrogenase n=1 Tax=Sinimarinibacterium thermocellulolyticum TaxID=3170016 RepID=A0ABV2A6K4_9GAMM
MNAVLKESNPYADLFDRQLEKSRELALTTAAQRTDKIRRLLKAILDARPAILEAAYKELRLAPTDVDAQLLMIKTEAEFIVRHLERWMAPQPVQGSLMTLGKVSYVRYEPKGTVLHISTWNAPIAEAFVPGFGAIAAGCTFTLKPSELAPHSAEVLADIVAKVFGEDEFAVVQGAAEAASALLALPFNHIFYIGGHAVGRIVLRAAAEHFATVTLEMGGKNPVIVDQSADLAEAGRKIAWGRVANAGQVCLAPDYALVHESVVDRFTSELANHMAAMYNADGKGFPHSPELPRIVNRKHFDRIKALLDDALAKGAKLEFGGETDADDLFISPTILSKVTEDMRIMREEIFGPVICIVPYARREDAIATIRRRPKPLGSYIFAKDREAIDWFLARTTSGSTVVNHNLIQSGTNPHLPFGGVNASGQGRLGGRYSFLECSNPRAVVEDRYPAGDPNIMFPPYSDKYKRMVAQMLSKEIKLPDAMINAINGIIRLSAMFKK